MTTAQKTVYEEKAPYSKTIKFIITFGFVILAFSYVSSVLGDSINSGKKPDEYVLLFVTVIYLLAMWSFFNIKFRISGNSVEAIMPPFKFSIPFNKISDLKIIEKIPWYVGWGLRIGGRRIAFVSIHKKALVIEKRSGFFRKLILTTRDPDEFYIKVRKSWQNRYIKIVSINK